MVFRFFPRSSWTVSVGVFLCAGLLFQVAGCGDKSTTTQPSQPPERLTGDIFIDAEPDSLNCPWHLTGPADLAISGRGDSTLTEVESGTYMLSWDRVPNLYTPFAGSLELSPGGEIHFEGLYTRDNPFSGLEFGTDATLEVVTWNLERFPKENLETVDLVARAVMTLDADILALQEITEAGFFWELDKRLADWTSVLATGSSFQINLAFLYRDSGNWTFDSDREILTGYSREFPRSPYVMEGRFNGVSVVVINNHFKCCGDNVISEETWDEETRRRDAGVLLDEYVRTNYADRKVIIVGDLNDSLTDSRSSNVFNVFLDAPDNWRFVDMDIAEGHPSGWSFPGWPSHLDHILIFEPLFSAWEDQDAEVRVIPLDQGFPGGWSEYDQAISDHLPVALKLIP